MNISNAINTVSVSGSFSSSAKKTSEKNKWQLTDSLKEKIVELAKKDAKNNIYMGNEFRTFNYPHNTFIHLSCQNDSLTFRYTNPYSA